MVIYKLDDNPQPPTFDFELPSQLEAKAPAELRGLRRDEVRLMVSHYKSDAISHHQFIQLDEVLQSGDVLVINTSGTMPAALSATHPSGQKMKIHLSTHINPDENEWVIEIRERIGGKTKPFFTADVGQIYALPNGASVEILAPYTEAELTKQRLWIAQIDWADMEASDYLQHYGEMIRYSYIQESYPSQYYQTVYATELGSAEMPSAGRAFSPELMTRLIAKGIQFAPLILHTGVASLEADEHPYSEYYEISATSAEIINQARKQGRRIIAVGSTSVRTLETVCDQWGGVHAGHGWTDTIIKPQDNLRSVDGMLTGFHEPRATHLDMLSALAGYDHLQLTYQAALEQKYLWHEFGDLHLLLP